MTFFIIAAIVFGFFSFVIGSLMLLKNKGILKYFDEKKFIDMPKFIFNLGMIETICGILFLSTGVIMIFVKIDIVFEVVLIILTVITLIAINLNNKKNRINLKKSKV